MMFQKECKEGEVKIILINVSICVRKIKVHPIDFVLLAANEPRLARQQEEMKSAWDQELEAIASDRKVSKD